MNFSAVVFSAPDDLLNKDLVLPHQTTPCGLIGLDIGGSLAKIVFQSREGGKTVLRFREFESSDVNSTLDKLDELKRSAESDFVRIVGTGGGIFKNYELIHKRLSTKVQCEDEMDSLITGLDFLISNVPGEVFVFDEKLENGYEFRKDFSATYPYLLVNIGSGVSIIKVLSKNNFERVGGSSIGGGTLWGLLSLLTGAASFDEMLQNSEKGDNKRVDMLVGDIYGGDYDKIGLKATAIASSFGKGFKSATRASITDSCDTPPEPSFNKDDVSRSLLYAVSNNIGQIAYLEARQHNVRNVFFAGSFIKGHSQTIRTLSYAIQFWSKGEKRAYFLRHEGYLGAMGALLKGLN